MPCCPLALWSGLVDRAGLLPAVRGPAAVGALLGEGHAGVRRGGRCWRTCGSQEPDRDEGGGRPEEEWLAMAKRHLYWRLFRGLLANPRYFYFILRREVHPQTAPGLARRDVPQPGTFYPVKLDLRIVYACNLRCKMCAQ